MIDGVWSTVGSTNMDFWSFSSDDEVNAVILSREFAVEMEKMFARDIAESDEVRWQEWKKRPLSLKVKEWFSHSLPTGYRLFCKMGLFALPLTANRNHAKET